MFMPCSSPRAFFSFYSNVRQQHVSIFGHRRYLLSMERSLTTENPIQFPWRFLLSPLIARQSKHNQFKVRQPIYSRNGKLSLARNVHAFLLSARALLSPVSTHRSLELFVIWPHVDLVARFLVEQLRINRRRASRGELFLAAVLFLCCSAPFAAFGSRGSAARLSAVTAASNKGWLCSDRSFINRGFVAGKFRLTPRLASPRREADIFAKVQPVKTETKRDGIIIYRSFLIVTSNRFKYRACV